jgi:hypothetical protein
MSRKAFGYASALAATIALSYWLLNRKKRHGKEHDNAAHTDDDRDDFDSINDPNIVGDENQIEFLLRQSFLSAASAATSLAQTGIQQDEKLLLYGLYKQGKPREASFIVIQPCYTFHGFIFSTFTV